MKYVLLGLFGLNVGLFMSWLEIPHDFPTILAFYFDGLVGAVSTAVILITGVRKPCTKSTYT